MGMLLRFSVCLLVLIGCLSGATQGRSLLLNSCTVTVHSLELRNHYADIRSTVMTEDSDIGVRLLDKALIDDVGEDQKCCFIRLVLRFYVERVFGSFASAWPQQQRLSSALANAFITIRRDINSCHCLCEEDTQKKIESLHAEYMKLPPDQAAWKAVGELNTVLDWLDALKEKN